MSGFLFLKCEAALLLRRFSRRPIKGLYLYGRLRRFDAAAWDNFSEFGELLFWKPRLNGLTALTVAQTERKLAVASRNGQKLDIFGRYFERYGALAVDIRRRAASYHSRVGALRIRSKPLGFNRVVNRDHAQVMQQRPRHVKVFSDWQMRGSSADQSAPPE